MRFDTRLERKSGRAFQSSLRAQAEIENQGNITSDDLASQLRLDRNPRRPALADPPRL